MRAFTLLLGAMLLWPCAPVRAEDPPPPPVVEAPGDAQLQTWLEELVDLAHPTAREAQADALAKRDDVSLERWTKAAAAFGRFTAVQPGLAREAVELDTGVKTTMTFFVPTSYDPRKPTPLLMAFHGSGADGRFAAAGSQRIAASRGFLVVAPYEPAAAQGYTASAEERNNAWAALRWARRRFNVDERRIFALGFSRGAHLAWDLALRKPDRFAGIGAVVGGPRITLTNNQNNLRFIENLVHVPIVSVQGAKDDPILLHNVRMAFERLRKLGAKKATLIEQEHRGHDADWTAADWGTWLDGAREPAPKLVVRRCVKDGATTAHWVEALKVNRKAAAQFIVRVPASRAAGLDQRGLRELTQKEADKRTARLQAKRLGPGRFSLRGSLVGGARLLLHDAAQGERKNIQVNWNGRQMRKPLVRSKRVLLRHFAERFDRTFLPTAEVKVP